MKPDLKILARHRVLKGVPGRLVFIIAAFWLAFGPGAFFFFLHDPCFVGHRTVVLAFGEDAAGNVRWSSQMNNCGFRQKFARQPGKSYRDGYAHMHSPFTGGSIFLRRGINTSPFPKIATGGLMLGFDRDLLIYWEAKKASL